MEDKKISIIIPAYNIEDYLERCLDSVLEQTYHNLEILVVDDGSTDNTARIIDKYADKDSRIIAIHQKNQGVSMARNNALDLATGDYIGFVDGDDMIDIDMYRTLVMCMEKENVDIAHCGYQMVFPNRIDYYYNTKEKILLDRESGVYELLVGSRIEPGLWNKLYKSSLFDDVRLVKGVQETEDLLCNFELFMRAHNSYFIDVPLYHYMIRSGSATTTPISENKRRDRLYVTETMYNKCKEIPRLRAAAYEKYVRIIMENAAQTDWISLQKESRKMLKKEYIHILKDSELTFKFKVMAGGLLYTPAIYRLLRKIHDYKTGINKKYTI